MPKFFTEKKNINEDTIIIDNEDVSHITRVLRLGGGDEITVCDGMGFDYRARITALESKRIVCDILEKIKCDTEPNVEVTLYQGIPKAAKMDYIIQKTTELGIKRIVPVMLKRCVVKLENEKVAAKKRERWQKIANEAAKQCGRGEIPVVEMPVTPQIAIGRMKMSQLALVPYECEENTRLRDVLTSRKNIKSVSFMVGAEGGFDPSEAEEIKNNAIPTVTLGRRILRTETAGEAVLAMIMYEIGDINA